MSALRPSTLSEALRGADPTANVERSIDFVTAGGDTTARPELRDAFEHQEGATIAQLKSNVGRVDFTRPPGPVAEKFLMSADPAAVLCGPRASAKSTQLVKKTIFEAQGIRPGGDGLRRYVASWWREKYVNLWHATIPTLWKVLPADLPGPNGKPGWRGSAPHAAEQHIRFRDEFGDIDLISRFRAFGDIADPEDLLGLEATDVVLNQIETLPEKLFTWLVAIVGRDPPRNLLYPEEIPNFVYGKIFGDMNAPEPSSWLYRDFYEKKRDGYVLYRQPGGLEPGAENIHVVGRSYYLQQMKLNAHRKWWININVHNRPGFKMDGDTPYATEDGGPLWDDDAMMAKEAIAADPNVPIVGCADGGLTPAYVYSQVIGGQARLLAEVAISRGGMKELSERMLEVEAKRFRDCEIDDYCDPSMIAGDDTKDGSDRKRLSEYLGREVKPARTNNPDARHEAVREKMRVEGGRPLLWVDPSCIVVRRGFNGAYRFHQIAGTTDRGRIKNDFTTHVHDCVQGCALEWGGDAARKRKTDRAAERARRKAKGRERGRYDPFSRKRASR